MRIGHNNLGLPLISLVFHEKQYRLMKAENILLYLFG